MREHGAIPYAFTADLSTSPPGFTTGCTALLHPSGPPVETGIVGSFDRNYVGGGPTMRVTHPDGRRGVLLVYQEIYVLLLPFLGLAVFESPGGPTAAAPSFTGA